MQKKFCLYFKINAMKILPFNGIKKALGITLAAGSIAFAVPAVTKS